MNSQLKQDWLTALRSGHYPQTKGVLRDEVGYCCLGVLCELAIQRQPTIGVWQKSRFGDYYYYFSGDRHSSAMPPDQVLQDVGITLDQARTLSSLNDHDATFPEIAALIDITMNPTSP